MSKRHFVEETVVTRLNVDTGEQLEETITRSHVISNEQEPFFCTYTKVLGILYNVRTVTAIKVFWKFCDICEFNTGRITVSTSMRYDICSSLGITGNSYYNAVRELETCDVIRSRGRGDFVLNPQLVWKGDSRTRSNLLRAGCKVTIEPIWLQQKESQTT